MNKGLTELIELFYGDLLSPDERRRLAAHCSTDAVARGDRKRFAATTRTSPQQSDGNLDHWIEDLRARLETEAVLADARLHENLQDPVPLPRRFLRSAALLLVCCSLGYAVWAVLNPLPEGSATTYTDQAVQLQREQVLLSLLPEWKDLPARKALRRIFQDEFLAAQTGAAAVQMNTDVYQTAVALQSPGNGTKVIWILDDSFGSTKWRPAADRRPPGQ